MEVTPSVQPLISPVVDTHCHMDVTYDDDHVLADVETAMASAAAVGVTKVIQVGCDLASSKWAAEVASKHQDVWATVALHPNAAAHDPDLAGSLIAIAELAKLPQVRGIGETGLDYFRTGPDGVSAQQESFRAHIEIAKANDKPVIIHDRDAHDDVVSILEEVGAPETVVFHCFSGGPDLAKICADRGWFTSFSGTVTFKNAPHLREAVAVMPLELVLVETDSPFLTPTPYRGRPNSSALLPLTVRAISAVRGESEEKICQALFSNSTRVFGPF
ncbi:MAG: TatD family hydrolase [Actinomycetales bacterium]|nr:TatD family hydrolase [Actinomycetales bacterium]